MQNGQIMTLYDENSTKSTHMDKALEKEPVVTYLSNRNEQSTRNGDMTLGRTLGSSQGHIAGWFELCEQHSNLPLVALYLQCLSPNVAPNPLEFKHME